MDSASKDGLARFAPAAYSAQGGLEAVLQALWAQARAAWPDLEPGAEAFVRRATERPGTLARLSALHAADLYLACAAALGEPAAVAAVVARLRAEGFAVARIDPSPAFLDDVMQSLQVDLLVRSGGAPPRIATYRGEGALSAWLRASLVRLALKLRPRREEQPSLLDQSAAAAPELELIKAHYRRDFERCFAAELAALPPRARSLLRLHYVEGLGIDQLAAIHSVSRATAARWLVRERAALVTGVRQRLTAELGIAPAELQSLMQLVVSQLHVTLGRALE